MFLEELAVPGPVPVLVSAEGRLNLGDVVRAGACTQVAKGAEGQAEDFKLQGLLFNDDFDR